MGFTALQIFLQRGLILTPTTLQLVPRWGWVTNASGLNTQKPGRLKKVEAPLPLGKPVARREAPRPLISREAKLEGEHLRCFGWRATDQDMNQSPVTNTQL